MMRMKIRPRSAWFAALTVAAAGALALSAEKPAAPAAASPQPVLLDTDIGDDIDDAFALALVLRSPEFHLLGITTEFGDTELRARLVDRYLAAVGRSEIPVAAGIATPAPNHFTQADYARQQPDRHHRDAVDFMLAQIRAHPGKITLIAIGPLGNVRAAIARDPATFRKLKRVVMMGGSIYRGYDGPQNGPQPGERRPPDAEWNIHCDPAAAQALLASGIPIFMMPLDSTQVHLGLPEIQAIAARHSPLTEQLDLLYHQWAGNRDRPLPTLFDPVAVTYAIRPGLCPVTPIRLEVDEKGNTKPIAGPPNAQVCLQSDEKGFLALLMGRILR
jgi:inosine-uridine nucleoside N-ribohydrolase